MISVSRAFVTNDANPPARILPAYGVYDAVPVSGQEKNGLNTVCALDAGAVRERV